MGNFLTFSRSNISKLLIFLENKFHSNWRSYLVLTSRQKPKKSLELQWCNQTLAQRFWATKKCLWASKISKIYLFDHQTGQLTSWKANFENHARYYLTKWYQILINIIQHEQYYLIILIIGLKAATFLKETLAQMFFYEFWEISANNFFIEYIRATAFGLSCGNPRKMSVTELV